jgi:UDP-glucose 4-epimerase
MIPGSRVLITGGAGLIGSHIAEQLSAEGAAEIVVLDNFARGRHENLAHAMARGRVSVVAGDIRNRELVHRVMDGIDFVFHQAAIRITQCAEEPRLALDVLVNGTYNVLEAAAGARVKKVVAASSASVYGPAESFPTEECHHPYNNRTVYGAAKCFNEGLLRSFHDMYGLDYVALRYFNIYGPRMDVYGVYTEVMIRWIDCIERGESPAIFGDGSQTMDFVYIEDVAVANILAAKSKVTDEVFNVASGEETSLLQLLETLLKVTGAELRPVFGPERSVNSVCRRLASTEKAGRLLGFRARIGLKEGLKRLVEWKRKEQSALFAASRSR